MTARPLRRPAAPHTVSGRLCSRTTVGPSACAPSTAHSMSCGSRGAARRAWPARRPTALGLAQRREARGAPPRPPARRDAARGEVGDELDAPCADRRSRRLEHDLVDEQAVGCHRPAHDALAEPEARLDRDLRAVAVGRVQRHRHARGAAPHHPLDDDAHLRRRRARCRDPRGRRSSAPRTGSPSSGGRASSTASSPTTHR